MKPAKDCATRFQCNRLAVLERCEKCRMKYYGSIDMSWEDGEEWREYVLDTLHHPERHEPIAVFLVSEDSCKQVANDTQEP